MHLNFGVRLTRQMLRRCQPILLDIPTTSPASGSEIRLWKPRCSAIRAQRRKVASAARAQGKADPYTVSQTYVEAQPATRQPCSTSSVPTALDIHHVATLPTAVSTFFLRMTNDMGTTTQCHIILLSCYLQLRAQTEGFDAAKHSRQDLCRWTSARHGWHCSKPSAKQHTHTRLIEAG